MLGLGLSLQKGVSAFNAGRALVSSYIRRVTSDGGVLQNTACDAAAINELNQDRLLEPASWVLVPDGIKEDVVYTQKPSTGLGDLTFTRASDATYTDSTGVVRRSPYNLLQQSEMFSNSVWTKTNSTIGVDATVAPNGTLTADLFTPANGTSGRIDQITGITALNNNTYTGSFYFKKPTLAISNITFYASDGNSAVGTNRIGVTIDLATFAATAYNFGNGVTTTVNVTAFGNNWYRASFTGSVSSGATGNWAFVARVLTVDGTINGTNGLFLWGAQLVEGTSALDYFPTTNRQDVPRIDFRNADGTLSSCGRLLLEPQRTNSIRNSSMVGAVAGSPGTLPTNWAVTNLSVLTQTIVGTGVENGLPYFDIRYNGTATSNAIIDVRNEANTQIAASNGQSWTYSAYLRLVSAVVPPASVQIGIYERTSAGSFIIDGFANAAITSTLKRFSLNRTLSGGATVAFTQPLIQFSVTNGVTYDFTIRIAAPQMELGGYATTWVPTTTAAVTRLADAASKTGVSSLIGQTEGTIYWEGFFGAEPVTAFALRAITAQNSVVIDYVSSTLRAYLVTSNVQRFNLISATINVGQSCKFALAYKSGESAFYVNGTQVGTSSTTFAFASALQDINPDWGGYNYGSGQAQTKGINQAALFPTRLINDQLEVLTSEGYGTYALLAQSLNCVLQ